MQIMLFVWKIIWKASAVVVALLVGAFGANQVGWSGAELVVNFPLMGPVEDFVTVFMFTVGAAMTIGSVFFVHRIAKHALWMMVPILLYCAAVLGVWNGFVGDFDATRVEILKYGYANGYALEHMSERGRFRTCQDRRIDLTDDAKEICARARNVAPGERIPGSEYKCGFLGMSGCFETSPKK